MTKYFSANDLLSLDRRYRLNLVNCLSGFKPVSLIGTIDTNGNPNLSLVNSIIHIGSNPALMGFILRPNTVRRDSYNNLKEVPHFTINHVVKPIHEQAHYTSAKFDASVSEFDACGLTEEYHDDFPVPYVNECELKIGLSFVEQKEITNGTVLIVGRVEHVYLPEEIIEDSGRLNLHETDQLAVVGLNKYYTTEPFIEHPYARVENVPNYNTSSKKPDNVVFNEKTQRYDASLMAYSTNLGAPVIRHEDVSSWKNRGISKVNHHLKSQFEELKQEYDKMTEVHYWNDLLYSTKFSFEPVIGEIYHLYKGKKGNLMLSLISPDEWNLEHLGTFKLNSEQMWIKLNSKDEK